MSEPSGTLLRALGGGDTVRLLAVALPEIAERTRSAHALGPEAARLAAEGVVATALLSAYVKGEERLVLHFQGSVPRAAFVGEIDAGGALRARLTPSDAVVPADGSLEGVLLAIKHDAVHEVYRGHTTVEHTSFEDAIARHLGASEQVDAILRIGVKQEADGAIASACGFLVERLPADPKLPSIDSHEFDLRFGILREADVATVLAEVATGGMCGEDLRLLEERPLVWRCRCSQEKVEATVGSLGNDDLQEMIDEDHGAEVTCHFCNTVYRITEERLRTLLVTKAPQAS